MVLKSNEQKKLTFSLFSFYLYRANIKSKHPKWDLGKDCSFKAFIKSEQLRRLLNYVTIDIIGWFSNRTRTSVGDGKARGKDWTRLPPNLPLCPWSSQLFDLREPLWTDVPVLLLNQPNVLGSGERYKFEPPVLEEESYAPNNSFDGLKRERMIHFLYEWLLWKRRHILEMNTFRNSFRKFCDLLLLPHAVSLFGFCCVRAHLELRFEYECKCRMVLSFRVIILKSFSVTHLDFRGDHML